MSNVVLQIVAAGMPHFDNGTLEVILYCVAGVVLLIIGYRLGRLIGSAGARLLSFDLRGN